MIVSRRGVEEEGDGLQRWEIAMGLRVQMVGVEERKGSKKREKVGSRWGCGLL